MKMIQMMTMMVSLVNRFIIFISLVLHHFILDEDEYKYGGTDIAKLKMITNSLKTDNFLDREGDIDFDDDGIIGNDSQFHFAIIISSCFRLC